MHIDGSPHFCKLHYLAAKAILLVRAILTFLRFGAQAKRPNRVSRQQATYQIQQVSVKDKSFFFFVLAILSHSARRAPFFDFPSAAARCTSPRCACACSFVHTQGNDVRSNGGSRGRVRANSTGSTDWNGTRLFEVVRPISFEDSWGHFSEFWTIYRMYRSRAETNRTDLCDGTVQIDSNTGVSSRGQRVLSTRNELHTRA